ncbi:MAG: hypothetical protein J7513_11260 [Solirubrobacteraceae bacterium]|nr:hypothetical protein [Solirubrobacteraceae bacterium]
MSSSTLIRRTVRLRFAPVPLSCVACFGEHDTGGLYCAKCACQRCGDDATSSAAQEGYCEPCSAALEADGFFG